MPDNTENPYSIEYYKYIVHQLNALNENAHKNIQLFQSLYTAIVGAAIVAVASTDKSKDPTSLMPLMIYTLAWLQLALGLFVSCIIGINMISWFHYRHDECDLLAKQSPQLARQPPKWRNIWRWQEAWHIALILTVTVVTYQFANQRVIPSLQTQTQKQPQPTKQSADR